jgi:hypothetical protein
MPPKSQKHVKGIKRRWDIKKHMKWLKQV